MVETHLFYSTDAQLFQRDNWQPAGVENRVGWHSRNRNAFGARNGNHNVSDYRYHVAVENHIAEHHWTEKLADAFLGATLPFYFGCPNASDYFLPGELHPDRHPGL
ncbi:MAG: hypothetical protein R3C02_03185 [Planctomycetaceae bacterium]